VDQSLPLVIEVLENVDVPHLDGIW
jgi:hypothetical protein